MAIYLDSAIISEAEIASKMSWVKGITTNPTLLAKSDEPAETTLKKLAPLISGLVFYQLGKQTVVKYPFFSEAKRGTSLHNS